MKTLRYVSYLALGVSVAGCAGNPASVPGSSLPAPGPVAKKPIVTKPDAKIAALPERIVAVPEDTASTPTPSAAPKTIDLGAYDAAPAVVEKVEPEPIQTIEAVPYQTVELAPAESVAPEYVDVPSYLEASAPLGRGQMAPIRDDPVEDIPNAIPTRASTYNIAALKANYRPSEALSVSAPAARIRNVPSAGFGQELSASALARLNPNVAYVADYKKIGYPWGDVSEETGVCTDVVIRSYRGLGIDLQSMVHEDMRRAFSAYPSKKIYGLNKADPNIDHRRVVNLEAFFERVGAAIPLGSDYQPGDVITWRLSGGEPHIGVVVNRVDPRTGNPLIVHNLGAGVRAEDLLDFAVPHGAYRFAPDQQSRMASLALKQSI